MNQKSKTRTKHVWDRIRGKNPEKIFPREMKKPRKRIEESGESTLKEDLLGILLGPKEHSLSIAYISSSVWFLAVSLMFWIIFLILLGIVALEVLVFARERMISRSLSTGLCFAWRRALFSVPMDMKASNKAEILAIWEAVKDFCFSFLSSFDCGGGDYEFWPHGKCYLSVEKSMSYEKITSWRVANPRRPIIQ